MLRRAVVLVCVAILSSYAAVGGSQTIRPLVSEYQSQAHGRVELVNGSDRRLNVVIEPRGFSVDEDGQLRDAPLPDSIHLKLSDMSFRIPPRQNRFVFYEATADRTPAWFMLYATFTGYSAREFGGVNVQLELPHVIYILPRARWKGTDVRVVSTEVQRDTRKLVLIVENRGSDFGRVAELEIRGGRQRVHVQGFPLLPGLRRRLEVDWEPDDTPDSVVVKAREFSFEQNLSTLQK
jgi:hypothetical protein